MGVLGSESRSFFQVGRYRWRRALRSPSEHLLEAIAKSLGLFGGLWRALVSHIDERKQEELRLRWVPRGPKVLFIEHHGFDDKLLTNT